MNDLERQLKSVRLAAPSETLERRMEAAFSDATDSSEGGARCPQRASEHPPEQSNQRVGVNALHPRSPESDRAKVPVAARRPRRRVALIAWLAGLGATVVAVGLILFAPRPAPLIPPGPSESAVVCRLESTGLMRQFLTETPASQRPLPKFTVGVIAPPAPTTPSQPNPSS